MVRKISHNAGFVLFGEVGYKIIYFFSIILLAKVYPVEDFGKISFAMAFVLFFTLLVKGGLDTIGNRDLARGHNRQHLVTNLLLLKIGLAIAAYALMAGLLLVINIGRDVKQLIMIEGLQLFALAFSLAWVFEGSQRMGWVAIGKITEGLTYFLLLLLFISKGSALFLVPVFRVTGIFLGIALIIVAYLRRFGAGIPQPTVGWCVEKIKESVPLTFGLIMITTYNYIDRVMLGFMLDDKAVGLYSLAYSLSSVPTIVATAVMAAFFPAFSHAYASDKNRLGILTNGATKTMATAGFLFVLLGFFLAGPVVTFFFGDAYRQSVPVLRILLLNIPVLFVASAYHQPLVAFDRRRSWLIAVIAGGVSNVIMNFALIPLLGANGAAIATVASTTIVCVIAYVCFIDVVPHNILASIAKPLAAAGLLGLFYFFVLEKFTNTLAWACILSAVSVVVYLVVLFLAGGITRAELTWLRDEAFRARVGKNLEV